MRSAMPPAQLLLLPLFLVVSVSRSSSATLEGTWLQRMQSDTPSSSSRFIHLPATPGSAVAAAVPNTQHSSWHIQQRPDVSQVKRDPLGINARGFHEDVFHRDYGSFSPMRRRRTVVSRDKRSPSSSDPAESIGKRRPEMDAAGFYGDTFSNGLGEFWPLKKRWAPVKTNNDAWRRWYKRKPEMDSSGFFGDTFSNGFGDFWTMKKKNINAGGQELYKRRPEMDSAGFYGDTFSNGFGDFWTVKKSYEKRRPEMDSAGFYGDTFSNGFGDFWTVKKRSAVDDTSATTTVTGKNNDSVNPPLQTTQ